MSVVGDRNGDVDVVPAGERRRGGDLRLGGDRRRYSEGVLKSRNMEVVIEVVEDGVVESVGDVHLERVAGNVSVWAWKQVVAKVMAME